MRIKHIAATVAVGAGIATAIACGSGNTKGSVTPEGSTGAGATGTPAATPAANGPATGKAGDTITLTDSETTVKLTIGKPTTAAKEPGEYGSKAKNGMFVVVRVTTDVTAGKYHANPYNFTFAAADGTRYEHSWVTFAPDLSSVDLVAGGKAAGNVVFDVPQAALTGGRIEAKGLGLDSLSTPSAAWTL